VAEITNNVAAGQWEARLEGELAGYAEYRTRPGRVVFTHTVVEPRFEGRGIASTLITTAVEDAIANEWRITPICPFVRAWLKRHPEHHAWVDWPPEKPTERHDAA
jgi:predicted GNAT family acetyltransferase